MAERDGVAAKQVIVEQLAGALDVILQHERARIATLGGDCAVSVAPFSALAHRYDEQARRIVADVDTAAHVVGFTIAEFFPRQSHARATAHDQLPADLPVGLTN